MSLTIETYPSLQQADAARRDDGCYLAGGTLVMRDLNYATNAYSRVLRVDQPPRDIRARGERLVIDAAVTMTDICQSAAHRRPRHYFGMSTQVCCNVACRWLLKSPDNDPRLISMRFKRSGAALELPLQPRNTSWIVSRCF